MSQIGGRRIASTVAEVMTLDTSTLMLKIGHFPIKDPKGNVWNQKKK